jgi:hypothetical protein
VDSSRRLHPLILPAAVGAAFVLVHVVLMLGVFDVYDLEETEYGNVAIAILDGHVDVSYASLVTDPEWGDGLMTGAGRRRRTVWSIEPTVTPFFAVFGPTMFSLKLWAITWGGVWAALWFLLGRAAAPRVPPWAAAMLAVLPLPLVQRAAVSATSITAHLGSSMWHAAALVCLLVGGRRGGLGWVGLSGALAGLGLYCGFSLAPLLGGVVFLAWAQAGPRGLGVWAVATMPGLALAAAFRDPGRADRDLITALTGLQDGGTFREAGLGAMLDTLRTALQYGAGFGRVDPASGDLTYLALGALYAAALLAAIAVGSVLVRRRAVVPTAPEVVTLRVALGLSFLGFAASLAVIGFRLETTFFDGLRYLLPLAPLPPLVVLLIADLLAGRGMDPRRAAVLCVAPMLLAHSVGFAGHFRPSLFPAPWDDVPGYEPWVMKNYLHTPLKLSNIAEERRGRWAVWSGLSEARRAIPEELDSWRNAGPVPMPTGASADIRDEFLRGFGMGLVLTAARDGSAPVPSLPRGTPRDARLRMIEGIAMGHAHLGCSDQLRAAILTSFPEAMLAAWYGFGRADLYCAAFSSGLPEDADRAEYQRGLGDAVTRDYGPSVPFLRVY